MHDNLNDIGELLPETLQPETQPIPVALLPASVPHIKGVGWHSRNQRWYAYSRCINGKVQGKKHHLGYFDTQLEAAEALGRYDAGQKALTAAQACGADVTEQVKAKMAAVKSDIAPAKPEELPQDVPLATALPD